MYICILCICIHIYDVCVSCKSCMSPTIRCETLQDYSLPNHTGIMTPKQHWLAMVNRKGWQRNCMCVLQWEGTVNANKQERSQATLQRYEAYPASRDQSHCISLSYLQEIIVIPNHSNHQSSSGWMTEHAIEYHMPIWPTNTTYIVIHEGITNSIGQFLCIAPLTLGMAKDNSPLNDWMSGIWNIIMIIIVIGVKCCFKPVSKCEL